MSGTSPNFDEWRQLPSIEIWEIASLIHGVDPRAASDFVVRDPHDPNSPHGVHPDTSWEERALISAVETGILLSAPANLTAPDIHTKISNASLLLWLRAQGYDDLAAELNTPSATNGSYGLPTIAQQLPIVSEPDRRLKALRDLGGDSRWTIYRGSQQWRFTKIKELVVQEKHMKKPRSDEKTIRKDLGYAAQAESLAKKGGATL